MYTTADSTAIDTRSWTILTIVFATMTAIMYILSWNTHPWLFAVATGTLLAVTLSARAGWLCLTKYAPNPTDPWWQPIWTKDQLTGRLLWRFTEIMVVLYVATSMMEPFPVVQDLREYRVHLPTIVQRKITQECPHIAPYITKRGEVFWCPYQRMYKDSPCVTDGDIDWHECSSRQAPGAYWSVDGWCKHGKERVVVIYKTSDGRLLECESRRSLCSNQEFGYGGAKFCVDYSTCRPYEDHPDDKSCY